MSRTITKEEIPSSFICTITGEIMSDPVFTTDGQTYERKAITKWLLDHNTSPNTRIVLKEKTLISNYALKSAIDEFLSKRQSPGSTSTAKTEATFDQSSMPLVPTATKTESSESLLERVHVDSTVRNPAQNEQSKESKCAIMTKLVLEAAAFSGLTCFMLWTIINSAGPLMVTVGNMDNCPDQSGYGSSFSDDSDDGVTTISCTELQKMDPSQNWPSFGVFGCFDGVNYQRSVQSLLANHCTTEMMKKCASILANAFFSGSRATPYSKDGEYVNAYGVFCEKNTSEFIGAAFIVAAALSLMLLVHGVALVSRLCNHSKQRDTAPTDIDPLQATAVNHYSAV